MKFVLATFNRDKARELAAILSLPGVEIVPLADWPGAVSPEEDGATLEANARIKARAALAATGLPAIADDTGLEVDRLVVNRVPLPLSRTALSEAAALAHSDSPLAPAAAQLASVLSHREAASREALAALSVLPLERFALWRLPLAPVDPSAGDVARWLVAEGAG